MEQTGPEEKIKHTSLVSLNKGRSRTCNKFTKILDSLGKNSTSSCEQRGKFS